MRNDSNDRPKGVGPRPPAITDKERGARVDKARRLMADAGIDAVVLEAGASLDYFTGIEWHRSERFMAAILPVRGEIAYICPTFEQARLEQMIGAESDVRSWQENESAIRRTAEALADRGAARGRVGLEQSVRFFAFDGLRRELPEAGFVSADAVVVPCRAVKSAAEIALIQHAMDITVEAYKESLARLEQGITPAELHAVSVEAHNKRGARGGIDFQFGKNTAFPHGSREQVRLREGDVVLMDGVGAIDGYHSDISRTIVFGAPTHRQRDVWEIEKRAQAAACAAARLGVPFEHVDAAARRVIVEAGFGPGYEVPGLPHRTGHGIGLEIHEPYYVVEGNRTPLGPGMCFSNEPMIAIYGEFGVRLEDCIFMTLEGPRYFTQPSPSIERPFV